MLGLRFSRLVHAALAGGGLTLTGCPGGGQDSESESESETESDGGTDTDDPTTTTSTTDVPPPPPPPADVTPPGLLAVELLDPQILRLTFTEAIAPVDTVNPLRFRLSLGRYQPANYYGYTRTLYSDPTPYNHEQYCVEQCYDDYNCYYQCYYGPNLELDVLDALPDAYNPAQVVLLLAQPIKTSLCNIVNNINSNPNTPGGLLLHYADGGASQITDLAGLPLAGLGKTWVKESGTSFMYTNDAKFPELVPFLPIPCPF